MKSRKARFAWKKGDIKIRRKAVAKADDIAKLLSRQAKEEPLPALKDGDEWWSVDEAYREELAERVGKSIEKGGPGSGHWGHAGRQGKRGGSVSGQTAMSLRTGRAAAQRRQKAKGGAVPAAGHTTQAFGNDPNKRYEFRSRVVSLDDMIASNTDGGAINPDYDPTLQPRARDRAASQLQIDNVARNMTPEALLWDFHQLDKGAPIVGDDMMVESGNGRTLALRRAREMYPEKWKEYQKALKDNFEQHGIDPDDVKGIKDPVLVRERVSKVDDRAEFAREANSPAVLQMSPLEQAKQDRRFVTPDALGRFAVGEGQSIDEALRSSANREFVQGFVGHLSQNERATVMRADGSLNRMGLWRVKAAMFSSVFPGEAGDRVADTFFESVDHTTRNFENALSDVLPKMAQAESLIASGKRRNDLSLAMDIAKAIDMHARLKEMKLPARKYVSQATMFARELTPLQEKLLIAFEDAAGSRKAVRGILERYADTVINSPDPNQMTMFGGMEIGREQLVNRVLAEAG